MRPSGKFRWQVSKLSRLAAATTKWSATGTEMNEDWESSCRDVRGGHGREMRRPSTGGGTVRESGQGTCTIPTSPGSGEDGWGDRSGCRTCSRVGSIDGSSAPTVLVSTYNQRTMASTLTSNRLDIVYACGHMFSVPTSRTYELGIQIASSQPAADDYQLATTEDPVRFQVRSRPLHAVH